MYPKLSNPEVSGEKHTYSFAGSRLTFLKLGSTSAGFGGCVLNLFNACHDNQYVVFFYLFCVFIDGGVRVCVGLWRGFKFSVRGPQN